MDCSQEQSVKSKKCLRSGLGFLVVGIVCALALLSAAASAQAVPPVSTADLGLPWKVDESATLIAGPHHNLTHDCSGQPPACNSLDFAPASHIVRAAAAGVVHLPYCGPHHKLVVIDHGRGWFTGYYHMASPIVRAGEKVKAGDPLGEIGEDLSCGGKAHGPHVHFFIKYVPGCASASAESERCYRKLGDPFLNTSVDVPLDGADLGGWHIAGVLGHACMTHVAPKLERCEGQKVTNFGAAMALPGLPTKLSVQHPLAVRPPNVNYTGDGSGMLGGFDGTGTGGHFGHLKWSVWSQLEAVGFGALWLDTCEPNCASGQFVAHAVSVRAFAPLGGYFTRLTLRYSYKAAVITDERAVRREATSSGGRTTVNYGYYIVRVKKQ
jgi:hypothetical protein